MRYRFIPIVIVILLAVVFFAVRCGEEKEEVVLKENVVLPEENPALEEVIVAGDTVRFIYASGSGLPQFNADEVVCGEEDGGYLKRVVTSSTGGDTVTLLTEQAALTDAVEQATVDTTFGLALQSGQMDALRIDTTVTGRSGRAYRLKVTGGRPRFLSRGDLFEVRYPEVVIQIYDGGNLAVSMTLDTLVLAKSVDVDFELEISGGSINRFRMVASSTDELLFRGVTIDALYPVSDEVEFLLALLNLGTVVVWIGPLPVVFTFDLNLYAGLEAELTLSANAQIENNVELISESEVGAEYSGGSWQAIGDWSLDGSADFSLGQSASMDAMLAGFLRGSLGAKLYGLAGPELYLKGYQYNEVSYPPLDYEIGVGLGAGLAFHVEVLSWELVDYNHTFVDYSKSVAAGALVEFGMNDDVLLEEDAGGLRIRVHRVEMPGGSDYITIWEGIEIVQVELNNNDFVTITNGYVQVEPCLLYNVRVTVDSLSYVQQTSTILLIDTSFAFIAQAFAPIYIEEDDEFSLVISIASDVWFDEDSVRIIPGHYPFENAALRIFWPY